MLLLIYCLRYIPFFVGLCICLCFIMHYLAFQVFAIILKRLLLLSYICLVTANVLWLFLIVPWVGLQCVIVVFPDHTHFLSEDNFCIVRLVRY